MTIQLYLKGKTLLLKDIVRIIQNENKYILNENNVFDWEFEASEIHSMVIHNHKFVYDHTEVFIDDTTDNQHLPVEPLQI